VVLEASRTWGTLYELLVGLEGVAGVTLAHAQKVRAIAEAQIKTDKLDSTVLAQLLRADLIPTAYIPPRAVRDTRELLRDRAALVSLRTVLKNRIAAIVRKTGVKLPTKTTVGVKSRRVLATAPRRGAALLPVGAGWLVPTARCPDRRNPRGHGHDRRPMPGRPASATLAHDPGHRRLRRAADSQ
jgi:hypothetical protein